MAKKVVVIIVGLLVLYIPLVMLVQMIESTFWQPNGDQLIQMQADPSLCFHNADCRTQPVQFVDCDWETYNKHVQIFDRGVLSHHEPLECLPIQVPLCVENTCTKKVLGIFE